MEEGNSGRKDTELCRSRLRCVSGIKGGVDSRSLDCDVARPIITVSQDPLAHPALEWGKSMG